MSGHLRKRSKNTWALVVDLPKDGTGKRRQKWVSIKAADEADADRQATSIKNDINNNTYDFSNAKVGEFMDQWFEIYVKVNLRKTAIRNYKLVIDSYIDDIKSYKLKELTPLHLLNLYKKLSAKSPYIAQKAHRVIRAALNKAVAWNVITRSPAMAVDAPSTPKKEQTVWTAEQIAKFLIEAKKVRNYRIYLVAIHTGMRQGEILGLRWSDINFESGIISVRQKLLKAGPKPEFDSVKTQKSVRPILMTKELKIELKIQQEIQNQEKEDCKCVDEKLYEDYDLVFAQPNGRPIDGTNLTYREFNRILENAKLPKIKFHGLRHSFATYLLTQGENPKIVQEMLGHSSIGITLDTYSHVIPNLQKTAVKKINKLSKK